jgi:hypothetical protein
VSFRTAWVRKRAAFCQSNHQRTVPGSRPEARPLSAGNDPYRTNIHRSRRFLLMVSLCGGASLSSKRCSNRCAS